MPRGIYIGSKPSWTSGPTLEFTTGTSGSISLTPYLHNPRNRAVVYDSPSGLPTGSSIVGTDFAWNGNGVVGTTSITIRANWFGGSETISESVVVAAPAGDWIGSDPISLGSNAAGQAHQIDLTDYLINPDGDYTFSRTGDGDDTAGAQFTVNSTTGALTIPSNAAVGSYQIEVVAEPVVTAESDWIARSTGTGVVWAHDFRNNAELTQFMRGQSGPFAATLAATPFGSSRAIQSKGWGTTFAANAAGGSTTWTMTDIASFPNPSVVGEYTIYAGTDYDSGMTERVRVTAINYGTNQLTVVRGVEGSGSQSYTAGSSTVGISSPSQWRRPFAAFPATQNGLAVADRGIITSLVPARSWTGYGESANNWDFYSGYYGHSSYYNSAFDGNEFWLQWRSKIHANRFSSGRASKFWYLQKVAGTVDHQFFGSIRPASSYDANRWLAPNGWPYDSDAIDGGTFVGITQDHGYYTNVGDNQIGGLYGSTCVSSGGVCYLYAPNVWTTWMLHVKPGRANVAETVVELFAAWEGQTSWTTVMSRSNYNIQRYSADEFDYENKGYNSFWPQNYGNDYIGTGSVSPSVNDTLIEYTQIILSQSAIAVPA